MRVLQESLTNWKDIAVPLYRNFKTSELGQALNLRFRNGDSIAGVTDSRIALAIVRYYFFATSVFGVYSLDDAEALKTLAERVRASLGSRFSQADMRSCASGGDFSFKEVLLFLLVRKFKPNLVVETGVAQGVTSTTILTALDLNGKGELLSVDLPNRNTSGYVYASGERDRTYVPEGLEPGWLVPGSLRARWELKLGRSQEVLPKIDRRVDHFFHDSEHSYDNMTAEFEWGYGHLVNGGVISSDDICWNNSFSDFLRRHNDLSPLVIDTYFGCAQRYAPQNAPNALTL